MVSFDGIAKNDRRWRRLRELAELSPRLGACGTFNGNRLVALVGAFELTDGDVAKGAEQFLRKWGDLFGIAESDRLEQRDRIDRRDHSRFRFDVPVDGLEWFGTGITVELSRRQITSVHSRL